VEDPRHRSTANTCLALKSNLRHLTRPRGRTAMSDDPTYLAARELFLEALRKAGVPEQ
jgi:hypothetical protein